MKYLLLLTAMLFTNNSYSQILAGEWKGTDLLLNPPYDYLPNTQIKLYFQPVGDSNYLVYSYCHGQTSAGKDTTVVAKVFFKKISEDSIYLEETEVLKPKDPVGNCLLKMYLKVIKKRNEIILEGDYSTNQVGCYFSGRYVFRKSIKRH